MIQSYLRRRKVGADNVRKVVRKTRRFSAYNEKEEKMRESVKREKRRGRKSGLAVVPAARLRVKLLLSGYRRLKVGISLGFYSGVWYVGRSVDNKNL